MWEGFFDAAFTGRREPQSPKAWSPSSPTASSTPPGGRLAADEPNLVASPVREPVGLGDIADSPYRACGRPAGTIDPDAALIALDLIATIIGFAWGGWTTTFGTTQTKTKEAVLASQAAICVAQFMKQPNQEAKLKELEAIRAGRELK